MINRRRFGVVCHCRLNDTRVCVQIQDSSQNFSIHGGDFIAATRFLRVDAYNPGPPPIQKGCDPVHLGVSDAV